MTSMVAYTADEAAKPTGCPRAIIAAAIKGGRLTARRAGASTVVMRADLERYVQSMPTTQAIEAARNVGPDIHERARTAARANDREIVERAYAGRKR